MNPVICIDGPSGAGKGTVSRCLAQRLGFTILDSGALYRLTALSAQLAGVDINDQSAVAALARHMDVCFLAQGDGTQVLLEGQDVTRAIREESVGTTASIVAAYPSVRSSLLERQRAFAQAPGLIADGRDMGTVVFPVAPLKVFLTASAQSRAARRVLQLQQMGVEADLSVITSDIEARDLRDATRSEAPLVAASDALVIDSTALTVDQVVEQILARWNP